MTDRKRDDRHQLQSRMRQVTRDLAEVEDADEERRLTNEHLFLTGALAALDLVEERDDRLRRFLSRRRVGT